MGKFEIIEELGRGGTATCYKAHQISLNRNVLLKILHPQFLKDKEVITRFKREAQLMSRLKHPNVVKVIDFGQEDGSYFISMEFIKGEELEAMIRRGALSLNQTIQIISELCGALNYVHSSGIIHRDINPSNILMYKKKPMITDFGLALLTQEPRITQQGSLVGTPSYMSFEQLQGAKPDQRTDIYSLGLVWLEMLTGKKGYPGKHYGEVVKRILTEPPRGVDILEQVAPPKISTIIKHMIEKDKNKRYKSIFEVLKDLKALKGEKIKLPFRVSKTFVGVVSLLLIAICFVLFYPEKEIIDIGTPKKAVSELIITQESQPVETPVQESVKSPVQVPSFKINLQVIPYARVRIDGKDFGTVPPTKELFLKQGTHTFLFINPRFPEIEKKININDSTTIYINLFDEVSYLKVKGKNWAEVYVDGELKGETPFSSAVRITTGIHEIKLHNPYLRDKIKTIKFTKGDTVWVSTE